MSVSEARNFKIPVPASGYVSGYKVPRLNKEHKKLSSTEIRLVKNVSEDFLKKNYVWKWLDWITLW